MGEAGEGTPMRDWLRQAMVAVLCIYAAGSVEGAEEPALPESVDPFSWLEERDGRRALAWVEAQNERTLKHFRSQRRYAQYYKEALQIAAGEEAIPGNVRGEISGGWFYDLWQGTAHPRGIWRRTTVESLARGESQWETLIDLDDLSRDEGKNWDFRYSVCSPHNEARCLLVLTEGGRATSTFREFDTSSRTFVEKGFRVADATTMAVWKDADTLWVSTAPPGREGPTLPTRVLEWRRGEPLESARTLFPAREGEILVVPRALQDENGRQILLIVSTGANNEQTYWIRGRAGDFVRTALPDRTGPALIAYKGHVIFKVTEDVSVCGRTWAKGSVLAIPVDELTASCPTLEPVLHLDPQELLFSLSPTRAGLIAVVYSNVEARLLHITLGKGGWHQRALPFPEKGSADRVISDPKSGIAFVSYESFLQPPGLFAVSVERGVTALVASAPGVFDTSRFKTIQMHARSRDGTRVPFFLVGPKAFKRDGRAPAILYGYGASGVPSYPRYSGAMGKLWLEKGGIYVVANVRGGGELGPSWEVSGVQRQKTYEDFVAVAQHLIQESITSSAHLGLDGFSSGGLLVAVTMAQNPDLARSATVRVPVLDLLDHELLGGEARVAAVFGSPRDPEVRTFHRRTSPYQLLTKESRLPHPFIITSRTDEQAHPAFARKYAAKMESFGLPFLFYESPEGGHAIWSTRAQRAHYEAMFYSYHAERLMHPEND